MNRSTLLLCCISASSAAIALGLTLSWFPTSAETKLFLSNNRKAWFLQKLWNLENSQTHCQNKAVTFLATKSTTKTAIKILQGSTVTYNALSWLIIIAFLAHSMNELMQSRGVRRPSVRPSVCKLLQASRYFYHKHDSIATKLAHNGPQIGLHGPGCAQGQGQGQRLRDTDTFLITRKLLLLPQTWVDCHQIYTTWSSHGLASRVCSRSRSRSKFTWYGHFPVLHASRFFSHKHGSIATKLQILAG